MGRPSTYTPELAARLCEYIAEGQTLLRATKRPGMPCYTTVAQWRKENEAFEYALRSAREAGAEACLDRADDKLDRATTKNIAVVREYVFHQRWKASKLLHRIYGDRVQHDFDGAAVLALTFGQRAPLAPIDGQSVRLTSEDALHRPEALPINQPTEGAER